MTKKIDIITIFPEYFSILDISLLGKAVKNDILEFNVINLRDFADPPHYNVDDRPYGGGAGMVMRADILAKAIESRINNNSNEKPLIIFTSPAGIKFNQHYAKKFADVCYNHIIFIAGRFEGYDSRAVEYFMQKLGKNSVFEMSIGDFVLFGGEVAIITMIEAISRLIPNVIGNSDSLLEESHTINEDGEVLLEYRSYTRPQNFEGLEVPEILMSGDHQAIATWRKEDSKKVTESVQNNQ